MLLLAKLLKKTKNKQQNVQIETSKSCSFLVALCKSSENQLKLAFLVAPTLSFSIIH